MIRIECHELFVYFDCIAGRDGNGTASAIECNELERPFMEGRVYGLHKLTVSENEQGLGCYVGLYALEEQSLSFGFLSNRRKRAGHGGVRVIDYLMISEMRAAQ